MGYTVFQLGMNLFDFLMFYKFFNNFSLDKRFNKAISYSVVFLFSVIRTYVNLRFEAYNFNILSSIILISACSFLFYYKVPARFFAIAFVVALAFLSENLVAGAISLVVNGPVSTNDSNKAILITGTVLSKIMEFLLVSIICYKSNRKPFNLPIIIMVTLGCIPLVSTFAICVLFDASNDFNNANYFLSILAVLGLVFVNYLVFELFNYLNTISEENAEKQLMKNEFENNEIRYQEITKKENEIRTMRHDIRNIMLEWGIPVGEQKKLLSCLSLEISLEEEHSFCDHSIVNLILTEKLRTAKKKGIIVNTEIFVPTEMKVASGDFGIILGNLLDNAIEACERLNEKDRFVIVKMIYKNGNLGIRIENPCLTSKSKLFTTTKLDTKNHGLGQKSVAKVCEKYNGTFQVINEGGRYIVNIRLENV